MSWWANNSFLTPKIINIFPLGTELNQIFSLFQRYQDIIVQSPCPPPNGTQVLSNFDYLRGNKPWEWTDESFLVALAIFYAVFALIAILAFVCDSTKYVRRKERHSMKGHKVTVNTP